MSQEIINVGAAPNDGEGDPIRTAFIKTNNNFTQLFSLDPGGISNGNSSVIIPDADGNIYISVGNVANIITISTTGLTTTGNVSANNFIASNYIYANAYFYANGAPLIGSSAKNLLIATSTTPDVVPLINNGTDLSIGTSTAPVIVPLATANSFSILTATGNVPVYTT